MEEKICRLTRRIRPRRRKHRQHNRKNEIHNRHHSNRPAQPATGVELPRTELPLFLSPHQPTEDGHAPGEVVARHGQREQRVRCRVVDQAQQAQDHRQDDHAPDHPHRLVADALADVSQEV